MHRTNMQRTSSNVVCRLSVAYTLCALLVGGEAGGEEERDPRLAYARGRTNLALGKPYQYSSVPGYRLTKDDGDLTDLTDGRLSERRDERIWFERHGVAWHGNPGVDIRLDLGAVKGIDEITIRFLGGREQSGLKFPKQVEVAVSDNDDTYHQAGVYRKLRDDAAYGVPAEKGKAWMHALRFRDLKSRGRYVALRIQFDGSFCAMDEVFVFGTERVPDTIPQTLRTRPPAVSPFGPNRYTAYPLKRDWFAAGIETWTCIGGFNTLPDKRKPITLILDLPPEVNLTKTMLNERYGGRAVDPPKPTAVTINDKSYHRYEVPTRGLSERFWMYLFWKIDQPEGWTAPAMISSRWEGGEQPPTEVTFHSVSIPRAKRPERLHISLDWMNHFFWTRTQGSALDLIDHCGFTAMPWFGQWVKAEDAVLKNALMEAEKRGMDTVFNFSPIHAIQAKKKEHPEILCQLPGGKTANLCPSYRGPLLTEHLALIAERFAFHTSQWVFLDCEVHWSSLEQIAQCSRCAKSRSKDESIAGFAARKGAEIFSDLRKRLEAIRTETGGPKFKMGSYAIRPADTRYPVLRFKELYPDILNFAMPSIYSTLPGPVRTGVRADRKELDCSAIIPWLQPGTMGEKPAGYIYQEILSSLLSGGMGVTYYTHHGFDAADFAAVSKALIIAREYEELIADGEPITKWRTEPEGITYFGLKKGDHAIWMVVSDSDKPLDVMPPIPINITDTQRISVQKAQLQKKSVEGLIRFLPGDVQVFIGSWLE